MAERLSFTDIGAIVEQRRRAQSPLINKMLDVQTRYNGEWVVPYPSIDDEVALPPMTPALIADAVDNNAIRASSVPFSIMCPAVDMTKDTGKNSLEYASRRRKSLGFVLHKSNWRTYGARKAYRHLGGYATSSLEVVPDMVYGYPCIKVRDPLSTFPEPKAAEDMSPPLNIAFIYGKSADWIRSNYPEANDILMKGPNGPEVLWDLVEWVDEFDVVIGLLGPRYTLSGAAETRSNYFKELRRWPNRAGRCTGYTPMRVSLDKASSQIANTVGIVDLMARLMALDIRATEKSIYPDRYIVGTEGRQPRLVGGNWKEGTSGEVNLLEDVKEIGLLHGTPDPNNKNTIQFLERNFSKSAGLVPQMSGEGMSSFRSGRQLDAMAGMAIDPRIQELQEVMEVSLTYINEIVLDMFKGYWPDKKYTVFSGWGADVGMVEFQPSVHMEISDNLVRYPIPGADVGQTTVILGQLRGVNAISLRSFRDKHPYIEGNGAEEERQLLIEAMEDAQMQALMVRSQQPQVPGAVPTDLSRIQELLREGKELSEAVKIADREAKEKQATQAPPPGPGQSAAPETMPGLAAPGEGNQQPPPPESPLVPPPPQGIQNFRQLALAMRQR